MYAFSMMPIIIGIFAVIVGSGLIVSDEERGRLDLIIAHPVGRTSLFFGRSLGLLGAILSIMFLGWLGFSILLGGSSLGFTWNQMAVPFLSLMTQIIVFATLALSLSMFLPSRNTCSDGHRNCDGRQLFCIFLAFMDGASQPCQNSCRTTISDRPVFPGIELLAVRPVEVSTLMIMIGWLRFIRRTSS
jgi:hypothetical protein